MLNLEIYLSFCCRWLVRALWTYDFTNDHLQKNKNKNIIEICFVWKESHGVICDRWSYIWNN